MSQDKQWMENERENQQGIPEKTQITEKNETPEQTEGGKDGGGRAGGKRPKGVLGYVFVGLALLCFLAAAVITLTYQREYDRLQLMQETVSASGFFPGILVYGQDVAGLEYDQAKALLVQVLAEEDALRVVNVQLDGQTYSLNIPATHNLDEVLISAFNVGREGELEERYQIITGLQDSPMDFDITTQLDDSGVDAFVAELAQRSLVPAVDATVSDFDPETRSFTFTDEQTGRQLYADHLREQIDLMIKNDDFSRTLTAEFEELLPSVTKAQLESQNKLLASFTTTTTSNSNRNTNIRLCSSAFNGYVVAPGEVFSINDLTGPRTAAKGYKDAGTIRDGILVDEPGGGVCQVSTTLFNAVVRAGMEIVERHNHSWPSDYVEVGMDAAIDYPAKDFKFKNVSDSPIYLVAIFEDRELTVEVYGKPVLEEGITIELRSHVDSTIERGEDIYEFDANLLPGETVQLRKGRDGKVASTYIRYMRGDTLVEEKLLFKSNYPAIRAKYGYGPEIIFDNTSGQ